MLYINIYNKYKKIDTIINILLLLLLLLLLIDIEYYFSTTTFSQSSRSTH